MRKTLFILLFLQFSFGIFAQKDSIPYTLFKNKIILFQDLGFKTTPFTISGVFNNNIESLTYINNPRLMYSIGAKYKWLSGRVSIAIFGNMLSLKKYGKTNQFNIGFNFTLRKNFFDVDLTTASGYTILNANNWSSSDYKINSNMSTIDFSLKSWYFHNKYLKMDLLKGKTGFYNKRVMSWYAKSSFNIFNLNNGNQTIIPYQLIDSINTKQQSTSFSSVEITLIPGFAYVNRFKNWQYSFLLGFGGALQLKNHYSSASNRTFIGLAPRFDFRLNAGYNIPNFYTFLSFEYDNKSVAFNELSYNQNYISVNLTVGVRLKTFKEWKNENFVTH